MTFGNLNDPESKVSKLQNDERSYHMFEHLGTAPTVMYLKQVDTHGA
jgi:Fe-S-cluster-containing dehydrogenase component